MKYIRGKGAWLALALLAGAILAILAAERSPWAHVILRQGGRVLAQAANTVVNAAWAEEKPLTFKPVPPESTTEIEKRRAARRTEQMPAEKRADEVHPLEPSAVPPTPKTPATPTTPVPPQVLVTRSGDVMRVASDIHVGPDEVIEGDLLSVAGDVTVEGRIEGDLVAMGGDIYLRSSAQVDGDVVAMGGELHEDDGANVGGQRVIGMGVRDGKRVSRRAHEREEGKSGDSHAVDALIFLLILLGIGWLFSSLGASRTRAALATLSAAPASSLGIGAVICALAIPSLVALVIVVALLCITIIGIPVALAALLGYLIFVCVMFLWGYIVAASAVGGMVLRRRAQSVMAPPTPPQPPIIEGMPTGFATAGQTMSAAPAMAPVSLTRSVMFGILILSGSGTLGHILKISGPLGGLGSLLIVLSWLAVAVAAVVGAGAWLTSEARTGLIARIWAGRRRATVAPGTPATATPPATGGAA